MLCPNCDYDNPTEMLFCGMCGTHIAAACVNCLAVMPLHFQFCGKCGVKLAAGQTETAEFAMNPLSTAPTIFQSHARSTKPDPLSSGPTPLVGERRYATIVIADVKSSTKLMEELGTEEWVIVMNKVLQTMASEIHRFGGEVDQFRGDGLVAFFGTRLAHEDDPERAVLASLMMQMAIQKLADETMDSKGIDLQIRVGINTGEVIAGNIGNNAQHSEDTAMGGSIALAARLESTAEPGTVLVSENTFRLTEHQFRWEPLGEVTVRGISRSVAVYHPLAPLSESEQEHRLQEYGLSIPLIGRENESRQILSAIDDLRNGVGGIAMVSGVAGLGKSRLVSEVEQAVRRDEALASESDPVITWLRGRARSYGHSLPHSMWIDAVHRWLGMEDWANQDETLARLRHKSKDLWGETFEEYYPFLAKFLSLSLEKTFLDWIEHLEAEGLRQQFFHVIRNWVAALAKQGPVIFVFTEAHWADGASLALLKHCLDLCEQLPILWMIVYRPDPTARTWNFKHYVETDFPHRLSSIELTPLSNAESKTLLGYLIDPNILPTPLQADIVTRSEGNPYYLAEIVRSLIDRGILVRHSNNGGWKITQSDAILDLPTSLINLLSARIARLSPEERSILQLAAVIGTVFWSDMLPALAGESVDIEKQLTALQRNRLIRERGCLSDLGTEYVFLSALIRDAAYESMLATQRAEYHLIIADFLEKLVQETILPQYHGFIAYHYSQADVCQKELFHTLLAAENAHKIYANSEALNQYSRALDLLDELDDCDDPPTHQVMNEWRLEALTGLGKINFGIGEIATAEEYLRTAVNLGRELGVDPIGLTRLFYWLGDVLFWQNKYEEPVHLGEEGLYYLGDNNQNVEAALMNQLIAIGCSQMGDHDKFIEFTQRTAGFLENLPYTEELRPAYDHIVVLYAYTLKDLPKAQYWLEKLEQHAAEHHDLRALGEANSLKASLLNRQGNLTAAIHYFEKSIHQLTQIGDNKHSCRVLRSMGSGYLQAGELELAEECIQRSLEKANVLNNAADFALGYWFLAQIQRCKGLKEAAEATFLKAQKLADGLQIIKGIWAFLWLGQVHFAHSKIPEITGDFQNVLENDAYLFFRNPYQATNILSKLERTFDDPAAYKNFVDAYQLRHPEINHAQFKQWYLTPCDLPSITTEPDCHEPFETEISSYWNWVDPFGDCSQSVAGGLIIQAANERNFHHINRSAPRFVFNQPITGDFTIQTICAPAFEDKPGIGGLLIWQNDKNWLCLELGARGPDEIIFRGFQDNHDRVFGRGRLPADSAHLRLEKRGYQISAYCSPDGEKWLFVGETHIPTGEPIYPGLHANGHINRLIYPGAFPEGTAFRFSELKLWQG
jgi:class 3 adenylate cyclase/tetratricopeptide (TPR) repeat protein